MKKGRSSFVKEQKRINAEMRSAVEEKLSMTLLSLTRLPALSSIKDKSKSSEYEKSLKEQSFEICGDYFLFERKCLIHTAIMKGFREFPLAEVRACIESK